MWSVDPLQNGEVTARPAWRRFPGRVVGLAATVGGIVLAVAASASATSGAADNDRILHMHTVVTSVTVNSAGNGGPGDVVATLFSVRTSTGLSGHADISCTNFPNGEHLCHAAFVLPNGQIDAQAAISLTATTFVAAVIGGTGAYEGASGQILNVCDCPRGYRQDLPAPHTGRSAIVRV